MQYTTEIVIKRPIFEVVKKWNSVDNFKHWQDGLISTEHISGIPNEFGAKMKFNYRYGKRNMEIIETITKENIPNEMHLTYTTKGIRNIQENYFKAIGNNETKWISINNFEPTSFKMSMMLLIMPSAFKKDSKSSMVNFKNFVEHQASIYKPN